jgi:hypothetical protein
MIVQTMTRLVEKRASKTNSWTFATLEERRGLFFKFPRPWLSKGLPLEFVQSEFVAKIAFSSFFRIKETKYKRREFAIEPIRRYLISHG